MRKSGLLIKAIEEKCSALEFDINNGVDADLSGMKMALAKDALSVVQEPSESKVKGILASLDEYPDDPDFQYFKRSFGHLASALETKAEIHDLSRRLSKMENGILPVATKIINKSLIVLMCVVVVAIKLSYSYEPAWLAYLLPGGQVISMMLISRILCRLALDWGRRRNGAVALISGRLFGSESRTGWKGAHVNIGLTVLLLACLLFGLYLIAAGLVVRAPYTLVFPALFAALSLADSYGEIRREPMEDCLIELRGRYDAARRLLGGN